MHLIQTRVPLRRYLVACFVVSGFCGLVYQVVWLRLAMARFGVTTPIVSVVLSAFMAGLGLGSALAGRLRSAASPRTALRLYAGAELVVAASAVAVPALLDAGRELLLRGGSVQWGSRSFHLASGLWLSAILLPFCTAMGTTFPLAMHAVRRASADAERSFSVLYAANVLGATAGTLASAFVLIEVMGFRGTLRVAAVMNAVIAVGALLLSLGAPAQAADTAEPAAPAPASASGSRSGAALRLLFWTGLCSMAMEVVWVRQLTPWLGNVVYTFAGILALYLLATFAGSLAWRSRLGRRVAEPARSGLWIAVAPAALLPLLGADPTLPAAHGLRSLLMLAPFCALLGFLTPMLVDRWSEGDPRRAGVAYAVNVVGCLLGPLLAGFVLLPAVGERWSLTLLTVPLLLAGLAAAAASGARRVAAAVAWASAALLVAVSHDFETSFPQRMVRRDSTATVIATGSGPRRLLYVNGTAMTSLTPITKMMAHLPLAHLDAPPRSGLSICFGMGTSFRSILAWGIRATAVDLVPSVPELFGYFHADAPELMRSPRARVVIDDGRRFLDRTGETFDVIVIDPPPPVEAVGSSLLYSRQFYRSARARLRSGGILQQWVPGAEPRVMLALLRALASEFANVRAFRSVEGWGIHLLASDRPIPRRSARELLTRMPDKAVHDLIEWGPLLDPEAMLDRVLRFELDVPGSLEVPGPALEDDHPINEYFWLRRVRAARPAASGR